MSGIRDKLDWFDMIPLDVKKNVLSEMKTVKFQVGEQIYAFGDTKLTIYRITSGKVRMFLLSPDGTELLLNIFQADECIGDLGAVSGQFSTVFAVAQTDCELLALPYQSYVRLRDKHPEIEREQAQMLARILNRVLLFLQESTSFSIVSRLAARLTWLMDNSAPNSSNRLVIDASQSDIATMIGVSRPTINQAITALREADVLRTQYGKIEILNVKKLRQIADGTK